ncbi:hypothetical protein A3I51_00950 [Candidatus Gottesmanbacteria bacterium RIFCSPLOWO2_02_FULL_38_8]|uniref:DUF5660 domain-containing protein n=1 Tax=Candidatus Gottesmanbacteria bacterium RIFCSPLOWO2_02_FULL_38_8 TaxID=1798397 RepID=A0A1F6B5S1_9BACT|nr:MAG: hypothetical protein A3I51_00950 [Candidatus Gottesmanbacteria bacterium RIFCSPLOWO2_02_FULL_38_8]
MIFAKSNKTKINPWGDDNPEKLKETPKIPSITGQLGNLINPTSMLDQIFRTKTSEKQYYPKRIEKKPEIRSQETLVFSYKTRHEDVKIRQETAQILETLKKQVVLLERSEKALNREITKVKLESLPPKTGIYYLIYFEWLSGVINSLRLKVEEGHAWLSAFNQRRKKRLGYWQKYKKHGTTFGLSYERSLATQTG